MDRTPTAEQAAIVAAYKSRRRRQVTKPGAVIPGLVANAYAGTGKTTILEMLAAADPRAKFMYVAYNAAAKKEAAAKFPGNARCYTGHGLAFRPMIHMSERIGASRYVPAAKLARLMNITRPMRLTPDRVLSPAQVASVVKATIKKFCYSSDEQITRWHVPNDLKRFTDAGEVAALRQYIPAIAQRVWDGDITTRSGQLPMEHDYYLKAFALTHPRLPGDVIALDEAQDSNPCVSAMILEQIEYGTVVVMTGDTYQSIYGWRGAKDAMATFAAQPGTEVLSLTQSFRFGPAIATEANKWLTILGAPLPLRGSDKIRDRVGECAGNPDAILCRTNAEALTQAIDAIGKGLKVAFPKGTGELKALTKGAAQIKNGEPCEHVDLMAFATWGQLQDYAEHEPDGQDLKQFVDLVDEHGTDGLMEILNQIGSQDKGDPADVTISTAHQAKGLEWRQVQVGTDFREPKKQIGEETPRISREDAMLAYVTVTRAQRVLDRGSLAFIDNYAGASADSQDEPERDDADDSNPRRLQPSRRRA